MSASEQTLSTAATVHPIDHLLRADRLPHILCPGCGIGTVIHGYAHAIAASGLPEDQHVCVSGIGCSGRAAGYVNVDSYHSTHGRALPFDGVDALVTDSDLSNEFEGELSTAGVRIVKA